MFTVHRLTDGSKKSDTLYCPVLTRLTSKLISAGKRNEELKNINLKLWDIEDKVRIFEKDKNFNETFVRLAREVYFNNDRRAKIKLEINKIFKSNITEIKKYANY